jgi:hypothetical protein
MAGISGRTGFVTVGGDTVCAYNWTYDSELTDPDGNRIEVTTFCSTEREYVTEDVEAEIESSITYDIYSPPAAALLGSEEDVTVGNADCTYSMPAAKCTAFSCTCPIEGVLEGSVTWEKTQSA